MVDASQENIILSRMETALLLGALEPDAQWWAGQMNQRLRELQANMDNQAPRPSDVSAPRPAPLPGAQQVHVTPLPEAPTLQAAQNNAAGLLDQSTPVPGLTDGRAAPAPSVPSPAAPARAPATTSLADLMAKMKQAKAQQQADIESLARTVEDVSADAAKAMDDASADLEARRQEIADFAASIRPGGNGGPA